MQTEQQWMRLLRTSVARTSIRRTAKQIGYADITVRMVLKGTYAHDTGKFSQRVMERLKPARKPRPLKTPQLKDIAPTVHAQLKPKVRLWGSEVVARWYCVEPAQLDLIMRGHAKNGIAEFVAAVEQLGIPTAPTCKVCGGAL